jgi:hypothetical protein
VKELTVPDRLDRSWYIKETNKRLEQFGVI